MLSISSVSRHRTQIHLILILFLLTITLNYIYALNITQILSHYPDLSDFTALLTTTGISTTLDDRTSLTILAVPNTFLRKFSTSTSPSTLPDVVRYHVLLQYLTWSDLRKIQPPGRLIPTLLETMGRVSNNVGSLNLTFDAENGVVSFHPVSNSSMSSNVIDLVKNVPFNLSVFRVDCLIEPSGFDLMASESRPASSPPAINISKALIGGHDFNVVTSMLMASGVVDEFERDEDGAGITFFVPTDMAFANLPSTVQLQALPADKKSLVLKFHVLHSYYPLGSLESIVNPVQPTLATEDNGAGSFTLNISRVNGSVAINSGVVQAVITQTVFDEKPVAIFGVSNVLLPKEIFGKGSEVSLGTGGGPLVTAQPPDIGPGPEASPDVGLNGPSRLSSPPISSSDGCKVVVLSCIGGMLLFYSTILKW